MSAKKDPPTKEAFEKRYHESAHMEGVGIMGLTMHVPCPFCAAPDWMVHTVRGTQAAYHQGAFCSECQRGAHAELDYEAGYTSIRWVQDCGRDPAPWVNIERAHA